VVQKRLSHWLAFSGAWILATVVGTVPLILPSVIRDDLVRLAVLAVIQASSMSFYGLIVAAIAVATWLALCQYIVLRALLGRQSMTAVIWIPASVIAVVAAVCAIAVWLTTVPRTLISISAIEASLPPGFPLTEVVVGLFAIPVAAFLGVSQGIVLSNVYRRSVVGLWLLANLFAALLVGIVQGIQFHELANLIDGRYNLDEATVATANAFYLVGSLLSVVLYAAVTGPTLFVLARPRSGAETSLAMSSGSPAGA
jgi:hypothetical protein